MTPRTAARALRAAARDLAARLDGAASAWEVGLDEAVPVAFLAAGPDAERFLFRDPTDGHTRAGLGSVPSAPGGTCYLLRPFDTGPQPTWGGATRTWTPALELDGAPGRWRLRASPDADPDQIQAWLHRLADAPPAAAPTPFPDVESRQDQPDQAGWARAVEAALEDIRGGRRTKLVLARQSRFNLAAPADPIRLFERLMAAAPECIHYLWSPRPGQALLGATPEWLYRRDGRTVTSEAIAGTRPRHRNPAEDARLAEELQRHAKDRLEHEIVVRDIQEVLAPLCRRFEADDAPSLLALAQRFHLATRFRGDLRDGVGDSDLLAALHPTPAVGGAPRQGAEDRIARLEDRPRGWYAGNIGWIAPDRARVAVAIRCGWLDGASLRVFAGAGVVDGSDPDAEWLEVENKIGDFVKALAPG